MKIYIAPMAGITDYSFRKILEKFSPDFLFTEMVNSHLLATHNKTTETELLKYDSLKNTGTQVFGSNEEEIIYSFQKLEEMGFKKINLNMGCPQPKIIKNGAGSALLLNRAFIDNLICKLKKHLSSDTEISIKIRTGYKNFSEPVFYLNLANISLILFVFTVEHRNRFMVELLTGISSENWELSHETLTLSETVIYLSPMILFKK